MPFSLDWMNQPEVDEATQAQLQQLFGKAGDIDVQKIRSVQQQLHSEIHRRDKTAALQFIASCDQVQGQLFFMVNPPPVCPAEAPCLHNGTCAAEAELPAGTSCRAHTAVAPAELTLPTLQLFAQCRKDGKKVSIRQFAPPEAAPEEAAPEEAAPEVADDRRVPATSPLNCPVCAPGTHGGCLNTVTGKCSLFNEFGICPDDSAPCLPNPCRDGARRCYDPLSPVQQPLCTPKLPAKCRLVDPSGSVCLSHACPLGSIESLDSAWQLPFYHDPINYAAGLTAQHLAGRPTHDHQVRLPAGGNAVVPVEDGSPCYVGELLAAGSAWRRRSVPRWESSYVLP